MRDRPQNFNLESKGVYRIVLLLSAIMGSTGTVVYV